MVHTDNPSIWEADGGRPREFKTSLSYNQLSPQELSQEVQCVGGMG